MATTYLSGTDVVVSVEVPTGATAATASVYDASSTALVSDEAVVVSGSSISYTVLAADNALESGETRAYRQVVVTYETPSGNVNKYSDYIITDTFDLEKFTDSFVTYGDAILLSDRLTDITDWTSATRDNKLIALYDAARQIKSYTFNHPTSEVVAGTALSSYSVSDFATVNENFLLALQYAQIIEANELIRGNIYRDHQVGGVLAESVGDSYLRFRNDPALKRRISRRAYAEISPYICKTIKLTRVV